MEILIIYSCFVEIKEYLVINLLLVPLTADIIFRFFLAYQDDIRLIIQLEKTATRYLQ